MRGMLLTLPGLTVAGRVAGEPTAVEGGLVVPGRAVTLLHPFGAAGRYYRHGWHSWSPVEWVAVPGGRAEAGASGGGRPADDRAAALYSDDDARYAGAWRPGGSGVGAVEGPDGRVLLLGALDVGARVEADDEVLRGFYEGGPEGDGGADGAAGAAAEPAWFVAYGERSEAFARYAEQLGRRLGRRARGESPRVWCSWYGYYRDISEARLAAALQGLAGLAFDVFQVDDGWQRAIGDWQPNERFPSGMAELAKRIHDAGMRAGLWMAPFIVAPSSPIFREHPDWLVRDDDGQPVVAGHNWGDAYYALDTTHPQAQAWLRSLVERVREWGYDYLKLDFLYAAAMPGRRHAPVPRERAYREGLRVMREAAGDDAYILVCGAPVIASLGLADGIRVGPDVAPFWEIPYGGGGASARTLPSSRNAVWTSVERLWLQPLIHTDPDVAYFRTRHNLLAERERRWLQDLARVAGFRATSDPPEWLTGQERAELAAFLQERPRVERVGPYRYRVDDREVDFGPALARDGQG